MSEEGAKNNESFLKSSCVQFIGATFLGSFVATLFLWFMLALFYGNPISNMFINAHGYYLQDLSKPPLSNETKKTIEKLIHEQRIAPPDEILKSAMSFYDTLITYLIGLIGLSAFIGFLYIKAVSRRQAEEMIQNEFLRFVNDSLKFDEKLNAKIKDDLEYFSELGNDIGREMESLNQLRGDLEQLKEELEGRISSLDEEETRDDGVIQ
ncbi:MAG: hypothetical protein K0R98_580 [Rickettsiaceae bacterium]|nr:hypothetical protein [Rickettsiaceae bacterium]